MSKPVIYIENLVRQYGQTDAVNELVKGKRFRNLCVTPTEVYV